MPTPELASEMLAALTALYEACERRANKEGGDFGDDIGPAAELAAAAIAKAALLDSLPSPVEGDAREIAVKIVADTLRFAATEPDNDACINHVVNMLTAALLSGERKMRERAALTAVKYDSRAYRAIDSLPLSPEEG